MEIIIIKLVIKKVLLNLLNFFIFSIINILYTSRFFIWNSGHEILQITLGCIIIFLLVGHIVETVHLHISNNCEKFELPASQKSELLKAQKAWLVLDIIVKNLLQQAFLKVNKT